ncbi:hypothetical protein HMPREF0972_00703 [Actinomyces sp. oral taxon 848 str. F0332]|nr:hypothetical protein HMPREF0972_00703 [Actinomyces sp. oral taxon 848 str. F0332]
MVGLQKEVLRRAGGVPLPCRDWAFFYFTEIVGLAAPQVRLRRWAW